MFLIVKGGGSKVREKGKNGGVRERGVVSERGRGKVKMRGRLGSLSWMD